ncbi:MAG: DUF6629 family protein [Cyanobacteria bacterium P01_A01_bin.37]
MALIITMCFSASASFTATTLLVPIGLYGSKIAWAKDARYLPLAIFPLAFGIQQGFEGVAWLGIDNHQGAMIHLGSLGFLFFSNGFWLVWPALTVFALEVRPWAQTLLLSMALIGFFGGVFLYGPFLVYPNEIPVIIIHGSINYQEKLIYHYLLPSNIVRLTYMAIVLGPLWLSELIQLRILGSLIAVFMIVTYCFFSYAFVSVWCFFAAIVSFYVIHIIRSTIFLKSTGLKSDSY